MTPDPDMWALVLIATLPVIGFLVAVTGLRWREIRQWFRHRSVRQLDSAELPPDSKILDLIESLHSEVADLAERQDFAERLLAQRLERLDEALRLRRPVDTPV